MGEDQPARQPTPNYELAALDTPSAAAQPPAPGDAAQVGLPSNGQHVASTPGDKRLEGVPLLQDGAASDCSQTVALSIAPDQASPTENGSTHKLNVQKSVKFNDSVEYFGAQDTRSDSEDEALHLRRVIASSIVGNTLEWYDFLIYTFLGGVITKLFFPHDSVYAQMIAFYGVFAAGFATRPLGALVFGLISDRYSRKTALMLSIIIMSIPTALVGCLPTYQQAGLAAPLLLVLIRVLQGFAVGGEFTSTMVFLVEHAPPHSRGLHGSWAFASVMVGVIVGSLVAMVFNLALSEAAMMSWGWRVPFLLSILGSGVGVYIRRHLRDPVSEGEVEEEGQHGAGSSPSRGRGPLRRVASGILEVVLLDFMNAIGFYLVVIFLPLYMQNFAHLSRGAALCVHTSNMALYLGLIPLGGWLSDKYGRQRVILGPSLAMAVAAYPLWCLFKTGNVGAAWVAQALLVVLMATFTGALPATFVALFPAEYRCTGLSIGHNISMAAFGGTAPMMATGLLQGTRDIASPSALLTISAALTAVGALLLRRWRIR
ncbi:hypothetical protein PLESTB_000966300 [Pleodorina starrii]|uniref:Major facilitator superfamily (MFS) profile domain-containing protein n=1 Tax=Pleodorina starrii TaxID=330485 RepID=A0A9W6BNJ9_9CHLO|nr:hypothetical protein PLESTM_001131600 [Pleodorina starrii]GLC55268.1 hypothetical protein PLESTB_000966300 [Pleodorina starrii]GLC70974.1 hypothetical protein PLESTF_001056700 [Pleodorina starrii]